jgi:hypothetical protein
VVEQYTPNTDDMSIIAQRRDSNSSNSGSATVLMENRVKLNIQDANDANM